MTLRAIVNGNVSDASDINQYQTLFGKVGATGATMVFDLINGYGCDPTGAVECSTAVNQAFTDAATSGKTALVIGYGLLKINKTINVNADNIMLMGLGGCEPDHALGGLRFKQAAGAFTGSYMIDFYGSATQPLGGCRIKNVTIDGNARNGTLITGLRFSSFNGVVEDTHIAYCSGNGIEVVGAGTWNTYNTVLNRVWSHDNLGIGFFVNTPATDGHATDIFAYYNGVDSATHNTQLNAAADGMQINSSGWQIYGYHAYSNGGHGLNVVGGVLAGQCSGGYLENNMQAGFYTDNTTTGATGFRLINNFIWDNGRVTNNTWDNVQIATAGAHGTSVIVQGNHIRQSTNANKPRYGVNLTNGNAQNCVVEGNLLDGTYGTAAVHSNGNTTAGTQCMVANNPGWNPRGNVSAPSVPATTVALNVGSVGFCEAATVHITAGAGSTCAVAIGGTAAMTIPASGIGTVRLMPGVSITLTYTSAPTWTWFLD